MSISYWALLVNLVSGWDKEWRESQYCKLECSILHTACHSMRCNIPQTALCGFDTKNQSLKYSDRLLLLKLINELRNKYATGAKPGFPPASKMNAVSYRVDLEFVAQCWANTCTPSHDNCRSTQDFVDVGQTMYFFKGHHPDDLEGNVKDAVEAWRGEAIPRDKVQQFHLGDGSYANLSQIIWDTARFVGCGRTSFWTGIVLFCNFGPGGNQQGRSVYLEGPPASNCSGTQRNSNYSGLCGEIDPVPFTDFQFSGAAYDKIGDLGVLSFFLPIHRLQLKILN